MSRMPNDILRQALKEVCGEAAQITIHYETQAKLRNCLFVGVTSDSGLTGLCLRRGKFSVYHRDTCPCRLLSDERASEGFGAIAHFIIFFKIWSSSKCLGLMMRASEPLCVTQDPEVGRFAFDLHI